MEELRPHTNLSHYGIVSKIGAGGMGDVYLADDTRLNRKVALKVLPEKLAADADRLLRFEREARTASALNHPNILTIFEFGQVGDRHFLATEFVQGQTLRERLNSSAMPLAETIDAVIQIASALQAAHEAGIIHRDIKPENIMIRQDGYIKVLDFGLAKLFDSAPLDAEAESRMQLKTQEGMIIGTAAYMSPEQARGRAVDFRTDIFSVGSVFYEMLTRAQPFTGETINHTIVAILEQQHRPLSDTGQRFPEEIERILQKTLAKKPDDRYRSAKELAVDLKSFQKRHEFETELERSSSPDNRLESQTQIVRPQFTSESESRHSIAVLPFTNMSADKENDYFCDGLAEELLNALTKIDQLRVAARTSAFSFKGKNANISEIGRALSVKTVLEGSVRSSGNRMRISVQLVNASDGYHLWSERYDREMKDIFDVQDEITLAVVDALKVKLFGDEKAAALKRGTHNAEAYQLYLKGRFCWNKRTGDALRQAVDFYQQAIEKDPAYALAYAGLAESYVLFPWLSVSSPESCMPKAKAAALRALEIDESLAEAHAALGVYLSFFAWDQPSSEKQLRRAIELNPHYATAHHWLGNIPLLAMGRFDESLAAIRRAEKLDPLSPIISSDAGVTLLCARRYDEAAAQFQHTLRLDPKFYVARYNLGQVYHAKGMFAAAIREYQESLAVDDDPWVRALLARSLAASGEHSEAILQRDRLKSESAWRYVPNMGFVVVYAALGETDQAFEWLERDFAERSLWPPFYQVDPVLDDLRDDPRFVELVRSVDMAKRD